MPAQSESKHYTPPAYDHEDPATFFRVYGTDSRETLGISPRKVTILFQRGQIEKPPHDHDVFYNGVNVYVAVLKQTEPSKIPAIQSRNASS